MPHHEKKYALVLAGGGAKGAFQIGAWKALLEEGIEFNAVTGASVGALNAGLIATGSYAKAEKVWDTLSLDKVVTIPEQYTSDGNLNLDVKNIQSFTKYLIRNRGLDTFPLYRLIRENLKEHHIRKSGLDLGIISFNLTNFKPMEVFLDRIPEGQLAKYLLASASFPLFKTVEISGKHFTDGGVYDNIPFSLAKSRGYKRLIVLDISGMGHNRRPNIVGTETIYIKNSQNIGWELDFSKEKLALQKLLGYLDTRKVFERNTGYSYFILPDRKKETEIERRLENESRQERVRMLFHDLEIKGETAIERLRNALPPKYRHTKSIGLSYLECAAKCLNIPAVKEYTVEEFVNTIVNKYTELKSMTIRPDHRDFGKFIKSLTKRFEKLTKDRDLFDLTPAEYSRLGNMVFGRDEHFFRLKAMRAFTPEITAAKILELQMVDEHRAKWQYSG